MTQVLSARGLHFSYPGTAPALSGLDLDIPRGVRLAVVGANGSGKTTLLLHLNGSLRPERGEVSLEGGAVRYDRAFLKQWRTSVGLVQQNPDDQLFAGTVAEDVSFGPLNLGLSDEAVRTRVDEALAALGIAALADRPIHMLSFGQKKRTAIAGVVAMRPRVLLLDEPSSGLDPHGEVHLLAALQRLVDQGATIVYSTHDVDLACAWSDRVAILGQGRITDVGPADQVLADRERLRTAHLRRPFPLEVGLIARDLGLSPATQPLPRSRREVAELLRGVAGLPPAPEAPAMPHPAAPERRRAGS